MATDCGYGPSGATHGAGTLDFMSIKVLLGKGHAYADDIESFFIFYCGCVLSTRGMKAKNCVELMSRNLREACSVIGRLMNQR